MVAPSSPLITSSPVIKVDFIADVVCPWCYLGWVKLKAAFALRPDVTPQLVWRPYQLDPNLPEQGVDRKAYMAAKFKDPERLRSASEALQASAAEDGLVLNFDQIKLSPNTSAAHRLIRWSQAAGVQDQVIEGLFTAYFTEGKDIGDPEVLAQIGAAAGMDRLHILDFLSRGEDIETVRRDHQTALEAGVTGVPFMVFDEQFSVMGAQPANRIVRVIDHTRDVQEGSVKA
jgi:predicted DsbA family dithiol-disulfide isomerase